jgi:hypothetical protein
VSSPTDVSRQSGMSSLSFTLEYTSEADYAGATYVAHTLSASLVCFITKRVFCMADVLAPACSGAQVTSQALNVISVDCGLYHMFCLL